MGIAAPPGVDASGLPPAGDAANAVLSGTIAATGPTQPFAFRGPMNVAIWAQTKTALTTTAGSLAATVASATGIAAGSAINSVNVPAGATVGALAGSNVTLALPPVTIYGQVSTAAAQITGLASTAGLLGSTVTGPGIPSGTTVTAIPIPAVAASPPTGGAASGQGSPGTVQISNLPTSAPANTTPQPFTFAPNGNAIVTTGADANATFTDASTKYDATVQIERCFDGGGTWLCCNVGGSGVLAQYLDLSSVQVTFGEPEKNVLYRLNCIEYTAVGGLSIQYRISQTGGAAESLAIGPLTSG